jgi:transcriptional regulator with XRE-family HTH domain|nr:MAG: helix-turn-helix domain protein [Bacteriophage sp.]
MSKSIVVDRVKVVAEMARQNLTTEELSLKAGVGRNAIWKMRKGQPVWRTTAGHVAAALGVSVEYLEGKRTVKRYKVYVYNAADRFWDCYEVPAEDPVDARNVAVQRLIDETGHGLDVYELADVCEVKD